MWRYAPRTPRGDVILGFIRSPQQQIRQGGILTLLRRHTKSHTDFIRRLQMGEHRAWKEFTAEWSPKLYNYLRYNLSGVADVGLVLEETMSAIVASICHYDDSISFRTFVYTIAARNVAAFHRHRQAGHFPRVETTHRRLFASPHGSPNQPPNAPRDTQNVAEARTNALTTTVDSDREIGVSIAVQSPSNSFFETLAQLPDQSRQAMLLRYRIGLSIEDIALVLGQSYNATCSLLRQGQKHIGYADVSA